MIELPFPSSDLAGHSSAHFWKLRPVIARHREWAYNAALGARIALPETGDIILAVHFIPPNNRGDRLNYSNRMKAYFDGLADGFGVNDKRVVPYYTYGAPEAPGVVQINVIPVAELPPSLRSFDRDQVLAA